jgi:hypothetical protein
VVGAAGGELLDVGGEEDAGDGLLVCVELRHGDELGALEGLDQLPDEDVSLGLCQYAISSLQLISSSIVEG